MVRIKDNGSVSLLGNGFKILSDGTMQFMRNGLPHSVGGPAVISNFGAVYRLRNGKPVASIDQIEYVHQGRPAIPKEVCVEHWVLPFDPKYPPKEAFPCVQHLGFKLGGKNRLVNLGHGPLKSIGLDGSFVVHERQAMRNITSKGEILICNDTGFHSHFVPAKMDVFGRERYYLHGKSMAKASWERKRKADLIATKKAKLV